MNYETLLKLVRMHPTFGDDVLSTLGGSLASRRLQLIRWTKSGKIIRLKRGLYTLPTDKQQKHFSLRWLANSLYSPSYLSLEYMLSYYDLIPERVAALTSVSTLKTARFENNLGTFAYRHLKRELFWGFIESKDEYGFPTLLARPEKALLDYIYLYPHWEPTERFMRENIRLQSLDLLRKKTLKEFTLKFNSKKVTCAVEALLEIL